MFCPVCRCEYRPGFTRCESCEQDLVETLEPEASRSGSGGDPLVTDLGPMVDFCGFVGLEDAREARDRVWERGIPVELAIRAVPGCVPGAAYQEEYWLRVGVKTFPIVSDLLGYDTASSAADGDGALRCSDCGQRVAPEETFCPGCGTRFEEPR